MVTIRILSKNLATGQLSDSFPGGHFNKYYRGSAPNFKMGLFAMPECSEQITIFAADNFPTLIILSFHFSNTPSHYLTF